MRTERQTDGETNGRRDKENEINRRHFSEIGERAWKVWLVFLFKFTLSTAVIHGAFVTQIQWSRVIQSDPDCEHKIQRRISEIRLETKYLQ